MRKTKQKNRSPINSKAEKAMRSAVAKTIKDHIQSGDPIVVWKNGKVVRISANQLKRKTK